jgi:hypothetical protein
MRKMVWVESATKVGWTCSDCTWIFSPSGPPLGKSMAEMRENYELQCAKEFAAHVCVQHPKTKPKS